MKLPLEWLSEYIDLKDRDAGEIARNLTMTGTKVEGIEYTGADLSKIVVGYVLEITRHPDADKLFITKIDIGAETDRIQVVTGATNVKEGQYVSVALDGSTISGARKIKKGKLRGVLSEGMLCSLDELGLTVDDYPGAVEDGILILNDVLENKKLIPGTCVKSLLGLGDPVIELEITPNRPDCLSVNGIAREAAAAFSRKAVFKMPKVTEESDECINDILKVVVENTELCPRYACRMVKNVKIAPSPEWMRVRLRASGIRPVNNIVDITNYVMLEYGQPMHAFDLRYLEGNTIVVRNAKEGEKIETLDGQARNIDPSMLMICDANKPVAVAGVMGGANSEIVADTRDIVFESANFNRVSVRKTSRKIGLRTESSSRFEKGLDPENVMPALQRAVELIEQMGAGTVVKGVIDVYPKPVKQRTIEFKPEKINSLLGTDIVAGKMIEILASVDINVDRESGTASIPSFRQDIECGADLAEEVARLYGYNNIKPTMPSTMSGRPGGFSEDEKKARKIRDSMVASGFSEIYTYSFSGKKELDKIKVPADSSLRDAVVIINPLGEEFSMMRTTMLPYMLNVIAVNYSRGVEEGKYFEIANTYSPANGSEENSLPLQVRWLSAGMFGSGSGFYELKGALENIFRVLGVKSVKFTRQTQNPAFHPGRTASIILGEGDADSEPVGIIGEIHPEIADAYRIPEGVSVLMIKMDNLVKAADFNINYTPLPRFPAVTRDLAIIIDENTESGEIVEAIRKDGGKILEKVDIFDVYKGKQVPEGMKSIAYSLTLRANDRTLTDDEADKAIGKILKGLEKRFNARLRF